MPQSQRFLAGVLRPMLVLLALGGCAPIIADYSVEAPLRHEITVTDRPGLPRTDPARVAVRCDVAGVE